ncbi:MAG TPA: DUF4190 domain-containing protein [Clostridia bacterium]|jgi:hypothetical protein|nr:DUF4190 domain-containing protein [Clostridia bacterium]
MEAYKGKATAALVLGIISVGLAWFGYSAIVGLVCGIVALVLGIQLRKAAQAEGFELNGNAKAGFVLGIIGTILNAVMFVTCVLVLGALGAAAGGLSQYYNYMG